MTAKRTTCRACGLEVDTDRLREHANSHRCRQEAMRNAVASGHWRSTARYTDKGVRALLIAAGWTYADADELVTVRHGLTVLVVAWVFAAMEAVPELPPLVKSLGRNGSVPFGVDPTHPVGRTVHWLRGLRTRPELRERLVTVFDIGGPEAAFALLAACCPVPDV